MGGGVRADSPPPLGVGESGSREEGFGNWVHRRNRVGISVGCIFSTRIRAVVLCLRTVCPLLRDGTQNNIWAGANKSWMASPRNAGFTVTAEPFSTTHC